MKKKKISTAGRLQMTIWHMRFACWITKAINTHSHYVVRYLLIFRGYSGYANALYFCVIRTLPQLLTFFTSPPADIC